MGGDSEAAAQIRSGGAQLQSERGAGGPIDFGFIGGAEEAPESKCQECQACCRRADGNAAEDVLLCLLVLQLLTAALLRRSAGPGALVVEPTNLVVRVGDLILIPDQEAGTDATDGEACSQED